MTRTPLRCNPGPFLVIFMLFVASALTHAAQPNYDPPQPSAEFGTPEATAKIAAKAEFLDVVGVKVGMPLKDAVEAVKAHNAKLKLEPQFKFEFEALPGVVMTPVMASTKNVSTASDPGIEYFGLHLTYAPNEVFVYGVWRDFWFDKPGSQPPVDTILAGMRKKYGPESVRDESTLLLWVFDAQKQQVMGAKAKEIWQKCGNQWMAGADYPRGNISQQVTKGYYSVSDGRDEHGGICHSHSLVQARYAADTPRGASQPLIMNVKVSAYNRQLEASGVTATNVLLTREANKLAEKRKEEAGKRAGPKF
ncbi:MAG: hypothetical protein Q8L74_01760 [Nitrospirota bacterium]|nr:hypothetical protein [Nitrospirota bacterium]MDP2383581.1 hypothetical protein [Nitrospirota bacterium]